MPKVLAYEVVKVHGIAFLPILQFDTHEQKVYAIHQ